MGGARYSASEEAFIREHYGKMPTKEIARRLGRSVCAIRLKHAWEKNEASREVPKGRAGKRWTDSEEEQLRRLHSKGAALCYIAAALDRSEDAVNYRMHILKLSRPRGCYHLWRTVELETMRSMRQEGKGADEIAAALGRSIGSVRAMLSAKRIRKGR